MSSLQPRTIPALPRENRVNTEAKGGVIVSQPGRVLVSYQAALGLQEAGLLDYFETCFYFKNGWLSRTILSLLPKRIAAWLVRELRRRVQDGLVSHRVETHPLLEILFVLIARSPVLNGLAEKILYLRNEYFDVVVGHAVRRSRPRAVMCDNSCALRTFEACKEIGALRILNQVIGHVKTAAKILAEERQLHPDFADSLPRIAEGWPVERCIMEVAVADKVIVASEYVRDSLLANGASASRILLCHYGVDTEQFRPAVNAGDRPFRILFVGQISQRKGIKYLLEAVKLLKLESAELVLMGGVIGSGKGLEPYEGLFKHIGAVPYSELPPYYQSADIFVYPSLHEGSALAIYEALASGLPVVTTHNSGSIVRDGIEGFIVPIRDVDALAEKMLLLYRDRGLRREMSRNARKRAESFTWRDYRRKLGTLLKEIIEEQPT